MDVKNIFGVLFITLLGFASCKKDALTPTNGIYRGVFTRVLNGTDTAGSGIVHMTINESDSTFIMSGDTSSNAPYSCSGIFKLTSGKIEFINSAFIPEFTEDPYYNPLYVLDTVYEYEFLDTGFYFHLQIDTVNYGYELLRI